MLTGQIANGANPNTLGDLVVNLLQIIPYCTTLLILTAAAWFVLRLIHAYLSKTELRQADYLESFQKLHEEGELTNEEFRIVRRLVSLRINQSPEEPKPDVSLLNKVSPPQPVGKTSGNIPK